MNERQRAFALEYSVDQNGSAAAAAVRAGYSERRSKQQASVLLARPDVAAEVARLDELVSVELGVSKNWIVERAKRYVDGSFGGEFPPTVGVRALELPAKMTGALVERSESVSTEVRVWTLTFDRELEP